MNQLRRLIAAVLVIAGLSPAIAQVPNFNLPPSTVIGRSAGVTGPAQAIPFSQLLALMLSSPLTVSQVNVNSIVFAGATSGSVNVSAQSVAGTPTIKWPTTSGTVPSTATAPIVLNATTGAISCPTCGTASGPGSSVSGNIPSFNGTSGVVLQDSGLPQTALPSTIGQLPAATPTSATPTITIASPAVITSTAHGLAPNSTVVFTTSGALPTGIVSGTTYYVVGSSIATNTFQIATSVANAKAGTSVNTSGSQSGTHTVQANLVADSSSAGAYIQQDLASGSSITMSSGIPNNVTSFLFPAGRWLIWGNVVFAAQGTTAYNEVHASLSTTSSTLDTAPGSSHAFHATFVTGQSAVIPTAPKYLRFTTATTVYLVANTTVTAGAAMLAYGSIFALRQP